MASWLITGNGGSITLPIDPENAKNQLLRKPRLLQMQAQYPFPLDVGPQIFNTIISGLVWPQIKAMQLDEMTRNADMQVLTISEPTGQYDGLYAVDRATIERVGPEFNPDSIAAGNDGQVYHYEIWFAQWADEGSAQPGSSGSTSGTDPGIGFDEYTKLFGQIQSGIFQFLTGFTG